MTTPPLEYSKKLSEAELAALSERMETWHPVEIIAWSALTFGPRLAATSSFQTQSLPLLYWLGKVAPLTDVFFLNTGFHFPETIRYKETLRVAFGITIKELENINGIAHFKQQYPRLYEENPHMCCYLNKVEPLQRALTHYDAWLTGLRRDQTQARSNVPILSLNSEGVLKICPMVNVSADMVDRFIDKFDLPRHPLRDKGYMSIGCEPCTQAVAEGEDYRAGRWAGSQKTECGLHFDEKTGKIVRNNKQ